MTEVDIEGYEGLYTIDEDGVIRSSARNIEMKHNCSGPYKKINLYRDGKYKSFLVHRLIATAFLPNPDNKREVNHIDGDKHNNSINNLEWATPSENVNHALKTGLRVPTRAHKKLTEKDASFIRELCAAGMYQRTVARLMGISQRNVSKIVTRKTFAYLA